MVIERASQGSTNTEPGDDMPLSGHQWGEANCLSAVPTGAGDNSYQKKRVSRAKVMMNRSRSTNNSNLHKQKRLLDTELICYFRRPEEHG